VSPPPSVSLTTAVYLLPLRVNTVAIQIDAAQVEHNFAIIINRHGDDAKKIGLVFGSDLFKFTVVMKLPAASGRGASFGDPLCDDSIYSSMAQIG
jgi:hypothetical protein